MPFATQSQQRPGALNDTRNFARLSQFIYLFHKALNIEVFDVEQLEAELSATDGDGEGGLVLIRQIVKRALRIVTGNRSMDDSKLDVYVGRAWQRYMDGTEIELPAGYEALGLAGLGAGDRTRVVLETCEMLMCRPDNLRATSSVADTDPLEYRVEPVGTDGLRRTYWLLCDTRLYRETPKEIADLLLAADDESEKSADKYAGAEVEGKCEEDVGVGSKRRRSTRLVAQTKQATAGNRRAATRLPSAEAIERADPPRHRMREQDGDLWELVCATASEWTAFPDLFSDSKSRTERALFGALSEAAARIVHELEVAARRRHMQAAVTLRKRSSRIALLESRHEYEARRLAEFQDDELQLGTRRSSRRLRGSRAGGDSTDDSHVSTACTRDARAQRREQARRAAMDGQEIEQAIRSVSVADEQEVEQAIRSVSVGDGQKAEQAIRGVSVADGQETERRVYNEMDASEAHSSQDADHSTDGGRMEDTREEEEEEDWMFRCSCGLTGLNYDDGRAMTACEKCAVWRHLGCALRAEAQRIGREIEEDDWSSICYVCPECRSKQQAQEQPLAA
ncbi:hypothetical protein GGI04_001341 [Coemansia thaxteri]|uniref:Zinc finger PHD-type domain-containing protein n=1 Tax=Coemansia thaxteri TaxID=2663907 RepID=A0A9W8BJK3_9FUNG|nr:hypothetical protein H4R26_002669 [Coemansia thaxteri]KAJ2007903.1 hypothetical protein GGI04_001341 [Coemansia thaxteri]KAJ2471679.1 hypothetical protein GGI02_002105 [Coemansia sp. RSA 2322]KAJ2484448.1 hypothetical protein EV174_002424 [Coemansia sp. RSA 2320]